MSVLNISAYKFVALHDILALREVLLAQSLGLQLQGTVLLAQEGINLFLAGPAPAVRDFVAQLQQDPRFADLATKESWSATQPFKKLLVKVKREIIRMDHPAIRPAQGRAPAVSPETLKRWLDAGVDDAGRPVVLLDTRNVYEVRMGTFRGALAPPIWNFRDFPRAVADLPGSSDSSASTKRNSGPWGNAARKSFIPPIHPLFADSGKSGSTRDVCSPPTPCPPSPIPSATPAPIPA